MSKTLLFIATVAAACFMFACGGTASNAPANNAAAATPVVTATPPPPPPTQAELVEMEKGAWEAFKTKNAGFWDTFLTGDFVGLGATGRVDRAAAIKQYSGEDCDVKSYELSDDVMNGLGSEALLLTYKTKVDGTCGGRELPASTWVASVYTIDGGKWKAAFHGEVAAVAPVLRSKPPASEIDPAETVSSDGLTASLMMLEKNVWEAWQTKDNKALEELLTNEFGFLTWRGRTDREKTISLWTTENKCNATATSQTEASAVPLGPDAAFVTYKGSAEGKCEGVRIPTDWYASFEIKDGDRWLTAYGMSVPQ